MEKKDDSLLWSIITVAGTLGGISLGYFLLPELVKSLTPKQPEIQEKIVYVKEPNPQPEEQFEEPMRPRYTRNFKGLSARFALSSTSTDEQSLTQREHEAMILEKADRMRREQARAYRPKQINLSPDRNKRLQYGSDGSGGGFVERSTPRPQKRKWRIVK